jgi:maltose alpha-D-glucosyltransferase/alpha-amylase
MTIPQTPSWLKTAVFYQVYPQSFADSNGDGIGDLPGLIAKLDYIKSLGVTALWLNPIFESPFGDAGYDISDFRKVAPRYGTNDDAIRLFKEAHKRGLRVVLDLVAGHTSDQHPWFKSAVTDLNSLYRDYYIFTGREPQKPMFGDRTPKTARGEHYVANFLPFQPALNFGYNQPDSTRAWQFPPEHPACLAVRTELRDIMRFWLDLGCDGFRVDMASSLIKGAADPVALRRLWLGFRAWFDRDYPDAVLVSEWSNPSEAIAAGYHVDFMIHFGETAYSHLVGCTGTVEGKGRRPHVFFERAGEGDIRLFLDNYLEHFTASRGRGYISLPTGNHDFQRPSSGRDEQELRVLYTMLFTMPGVPFLYYGDEIGMRNIEGLPEKEGSMWRTGNRTPMQWEKGAPNLGFSTASRKSLYLPVDSAKDAPTVSEQAKHKNSLLHHTRQLIALRKKHSALGNDGAFKPLYAEAGRYPFIYERSDANGRFAVAINPGEAARTVELPVLKGAKLILGKGIKLGGNRLVMPGVSYAVFKLKK